MSPEAPESACDLLSTTSAARSISLLAKPCAIAAKVPIEHRTDDHRIRRFEPLRRRKPLSRPYTSSRPWADPVTLTKTGGASPAPRRQFEVHFPLGDDLGHLRYRELNPAAGNQQAFEQAYAVMMPEAPVKARQIVSGIFHPECVVQVDQQARGNQAVMMPKVSAATAKKGDEQKQAIVRYEPEPDEATADRQYVQRPPGCSSSPVRTKRRGRHTAPPVSAD